MKAYDGLSEGDAAVVRRVATAMGDGVLGPHNKTFPLMARRVFDDLVRERLLVSGPKAKKISVDANSQLEVEDYRRTRSLAT